MFKLNRDFMKTEVNIVKKPVEVQNELIFIMTAVIFSNDFSTMTMFCGYAEERIKKSLIEEFTRRMCVVFRVRK